MDETSSPIEQFRQKIKEYGELQSEVVDNFLVGNERPSLYLPQETIDDMSSKEFFVYKCMLEASMLTMAPKEYIEERIEVARSSTDALRGAFEGNIDRTGSGSSIAKIFRDSETPLSDIISSDVADGFFEIVDIVNEQRPNLKLTDNLVYIYLAENGDLLSHSMMSGEDKKLHNKEIEEDMWADRDMVETMVCSAVGKRTVLHMVYKGLLSEDHDYRSIGIYIAPEDMSKVEATRKRRSRVEASGYTSTISEDHYYETGGDVIKQTQDLTMTAYVATIGGSNRNKEIHQPTAIDAGEKRFVIDCMNTAIQVLKLFRHMDKTHLKRVLDD